MGRVARVWDLLDRAAARAFLGPDASRSSEIPLPCRALIVPDHLAGDFDVQGAAGAGLVTLRLRGRILLAGYSAPLKEAVRRSGLAAEVSRALDDYAAPAPDLVFADGERWTLARRARAMGILNVTPDSFSDGGRFVDPGAASERAAQMVAEGAEAIDVGAESTRPGAAPVDAEEEWRRLEGVIPRLRRELPAVRISIDTRRASTAERALDAGCDIVNDVSALDDPGMAPLVAARGCPVALMHMRGAPRDMQRDTSYRDLPAEVADHLSKRCDAARSAGIRSDRILLDPGFGFGKSPEGNENLLLQLGSLRSLGRPILIGVSRKAFIGRRTGVDSPDMRVAGSIAAAVQAVHAGARIVRTHDVAATRQALDVAEIPAGPPAPRLAGQTEGP